jgi:hypothetical protein
MVLDDFQTLSKKAKGAIADGKPCFYQCHSHLGNKDQVEFREAITSP